MYRYRYRYRFLFYPRFPLQGGAGFRRADDRHPHGALCGKMAILPLSQAVPGVCI